MERGGTSYTEFKVFKKKKMNLAIATSENNSKFKIDYQMTECSIFVPMSYLRHKFWMTLLEECTNLTNLREFKCKVKTWCLGVRLVIWMNCIFSE